MSFGNGCWAADQGRTPNTVQLERARKLPVEAGVADRGQFDQEYASGLPNPDETFDVLLFFESPCHFRNRHHFFQDVKRRVRLDGWLAGEDWLSSEGLRGVEVVRNIHPIYETWAILNLGTCVEYASAMAAADLVVKGAVDLRSEMALLEAF